MVSEIVAVCSVAWNALFMWSVSDSLAKRSQTAMHRDSSSTTAPNERAKLA